MDQVGADKNDAAVLVHVDSFQDEIIEHELDCASGQVLPNPKLVSAGIVQMIALLHTVQDPSPVRINTLSTVRDEYGGSAGKIADGSGCDSSLRLLQHDGRTTSISTTLHLLLHDVWLGWRWRWRLLLLLLLNTWWL